MLLSDLRRDYLQTQIVELDAEDAAQQLSDTYSALEEQAYQEYETEDIARSRVHFLRYGRFRYQNQEHSTEIDLPKADPSPPIRWLTFWNTSTPPTSVNIPIAWMRP